MKIQTSSPQMIRASAQPEAPKSSAPAQEKWDSVTFDSASNTYHFERPGHHYSVMRTNPLREGLIAATVIGLPSALGAAENAMMGALGATALTAFVAPTAGAVLGGALAGRAAYKGTHENPMYTGLAAIAGAGVGAVAFPLLKLPGVWGGATGAAVAAGVLGGGVAIWSAVNNHKIDQKAIDAGYKPQG